MAAVGDATTPAPPRAGSISGSAALTDPAERPRGATPIPTSAPPSGVPVTRVERTPSAASRGVPPADPAAGMVTTEAPNAFDLALYYHRAGDFENALLQYRTLLQANELNAQAHNNLGLLYQEKNLLDDSARELQRALFIDPGYAAAHMNYGVTLLRQEKLDAAAAEFRSLLALEPGNADALVNLALVEQAAAEPGRAQATLLRALSMSPKNPAAHYNLAVLYDKAGEPGRAVEHYRAFLDTAGAEYAARAPAVRARIATLAR